MSDPVTNVDIEDVLASIRRLVLQGPPGPDAPPAPPARGRLVLTQALRVEEPEPLDLDEAGRDAGGRDAGNWDAGDGDGDRRESEPAGGLPERSGLPGREEPADGESDAVLDLREVVAESASILVLSAPMAVPTRATDLRGIEAALSDAPDGWEPDGSEDLDWSLGGVAEAAPAPVFRHRALGAPPAPPEPQASVSGAPGAAGLDEARLRALVTEVLRAELQGELGERMTRNIRKLVRREIFRVLETRDDG